MQPPLPLSLSHEILIQHKLLVSQVFDNTIGQIKKATTKEFVIIKKELSRVSHNADGPITSLAV